MSTISKHFETLAEAEQHQDRLYNRYDYVRLIICPRFSEDGTDIWQVK